MGSKQSHFAKIGEIITGKGDDDLIAVGLGSCIALVIYDNSTNLAGLAHIALPKVTEPPKRIEIPNLDMPGRYAETAIPLLIDKLEKMGGDKTQFRAKFAGGASIFGTKGLLLGSILNIGKRNSDEIESLLKKHGIAIMGKSVGGDKAKSIVFNVGSKLMTITNSKQEMKQVL